MNTIDLLDLSNCAGFNLRKTARRLSQVYEDALRPTGLRGGQFSLLAHIYRLPPTPMSVLAAEMAMARTTLTRNLGPLRKEGLVSIRPGKDARVQEVSITELGRIRFKAALPFWRAVQARVVESMGEGTVIQLLGNLQLVRNVASDLTPEP